ncbi:MAG: sortase [Actinomycetota bacterium]
MSERGSVRRRRLAGRTATLLGVLCALSAIGVLSYAAWELWGTGGQEAAVQEELRASYDAVDDADPVTTTEAPIEADDESGESDDAADAAVEVDPDEALLPGGVAPRIARARFPEAGQALARLEIPSIELDKFIMRDVGVVSLQVGPGHYLGTPRPGFAGNAAIAGHRTTYGAPFGRVDELQPGDEITVHSADGIFTYVVLSPDEAFGDRLAEFDEDDITDGHVIVQPTDTWVVADFGDARLTLTSCHPEFTSRDRIIVVAELVSEAAPFADIFGGLGEDELVELVTEDLTVLDDSAS